MADFRRFPGCRSATMAAAGADMRRQSVRQVALWCDHCLRPRLHARLFAVDRPDVLTLRFLIRQLSELGPAQDRALDSSPSGLTHALGRPATALNPAYPFDARTQRASSLLAPTFRRNCDISVYFSGYPNWGTAQNGFQPCYRIIIPMTKSRRYFFKSLRWEVPPPDLCFV